MPEYGLSLNPAELRQVAKSLTLLDTFYRLTNTAAPAALHSIDPKLQDLLDLARLDEDLKKGTPEA